MASKIQRKAWDEARERVGAKWYSELTEAEREIVRVAQYPRTVNPRGQVLYTVIRNADAPIPVYGVWYTGVYIKQCRLDPFAVATVEDHGNHYRTRGDGRYDRWKTVPKGH